MSLRFLIFSILFLIFLALKSQTPETVRVAFYNVENLFHPDDDSAKMDEEFTPGGLRNWSEWRYREKLNRTAKAILSIGEWEPAAVIGLAEIENRQVLDDLVKTPTLSKFNYEILHYESPDRRGIDVAMVFRPAFFQLDYSKNIPVKMSDDPHFFTRDILYAKGIIHQKDTLHLMFCHWPSRYGGQAQSEPKRIQAAATVRAAVDSIQQKNPNAHVIILGDFNDEFHDLSLKESLGARTEIPAPAEKSLVNLMALLPPTGGSHRYQGVWSYLDQIIVSQNLLDDESLEICPKNAQVAERDFLLETDEKYPGQRPFRSFLGLRWHGGFSDHLPVFIDLCARQSH